MKQDTRLQLKLQNREENLSPVTHPPSNQILVTGALGNVSSSQGIQVLGGCGCTAPEAQNADTWPISHLITLWILGAKFLAEVLQEVMLNRAEGGCDWHNSVSGMEMTDVWPKAAFAFSDITDICRAFCCLPVRLCLDRKICPKNSQFETSDIVIMELNQWQSNGNVLSKSSSRWTTSKKIIQKKVNSVVLCDQVLKYLLLKILASKKWFL